MTRSEIRGSLRGARDALLRARMALLEGMEDDEVILTPSDIEEMYPVIKEMQQFLTDIKKVEAQFASVASMRKEMTPLEVTK